ncbi:hypothetical protein CIL03_16200 [Virgibacillus indicus]|uniref:Uncharacterized protein n=1 Tax=Virgibacillus indicus TaxID=2024554 RepID=A0A265N851_9BACI|nr:hypothetical protein CIL03_16200 [Virgibacillus indicus]
MEISSKLKVTNSEDIRHQVHIVDVPLSAFRKKRSKYSLKVKKKYTHQKAVVKVTLDKSIIHNKQNISKDFIAIKFDNKINIFIEKQDADQKFIKKMGRYRISYMPIDADKLSIKVKSHFKQAFYKNVILPRIKKMRSKEEHMKNQKQNKGTYTPEDLRKSDFYYADKFPYHHSPNSDGNRSRREVFGGAFSGISRSGGKRKRK